MQYKYRVMVVYIVGLFMTIIDGTIVNVALPTLAREFEVSSTDIEWVSVAYLLALAAVIPAAGWLGDRYGTKRMFAVALAVFVIASGLCGAAPSLTLLVVFRILQGLGAGLITPIGSAMLFRAFPLAERSTATVGVLSVAVVAPAIGPVLGGVLVDNTSWRWIFFVNLPIGALALTLAVLWLREERHEAAGRLDLRGLVLSATGVSLLIYTLSTGPENGWLAAPDDRHRGDRPGRGHRARGGRTRHRTPDAATAAVHEPALPHRQHLRLDGLRRVLRVDLRAPALHADPARVQRNAVRPRPGAAGARGVRRVEPHRQTRVPDGRATAADGGRFGGDRGLHRRLRARRPRHAAVDDRDRIARCAALRSGWCSCRSRPRCTRPSSNADTGRATSLFNTQRQIAFASGVALAASVIAAKVSAVGGDAAPAVDRLPAYQWGFLAMGLVMLPAAVASWFVHDEDVAATRGLA